MRAMIGFIWNIGLTIIDFVYAFSLYNAGRMKWACLMFFCAGMMIVTTGFYTRDFISRKMKEIENGN